MNDESDISIELVVVKVGTHKFFKWLREAPVSESTHRQHTLITNILYANLYGNVYRVKFIIKNPQGDTVSTGEISSVGTHANYDAWVFRPSWKYSSELHADEFKCDTKITLYISLEDWLKSSTDADKHTKYNGVKWCGRVWRNVCNLVT